MTTSRYRTLAISGVIAALYAVISLALMPISFGVYQVRVAEALTVLPFLTPAAIPGLFVGCLISNVFGGLGWQDIVFGSLLTLLAAIATYGLGRLSSNNRLQRTAIWLAPLPPVLLNAFGVSVYLAPLIGVNYWFSVQMVGLGEVISCYILGLPLLMVLRRRGAYFFN